MTTSSSRLRFLRQLSCKALANNLSYAYTLMLSDPEANTYCYVIRLHEGTRITTARAMSVRSELLLLQHVLRAQHNQPETHNA